MKLRGEKILVTGGAGFIGSHLVEYLVGLGCEVVVLDDFSNGKLDNIEFLLSTQKLKIVKGSIIDSKVCESVISDVSVVFHLACLGVRHSIHDPIENHQINALGTLNVLESSRKFKIKRFIYMSTSEVYGRTVDFPITEETTTWPLTVYGGGKLAGEHYSRAYHECYQLPVIRVRPFNNYGERSHFEGDAGEVIPRFILRCLSGQAPVIFGDGSHTRDFLYVKDCIEALVSIAECDALIGNIVNLGYGEEVSIENLAKIIIDEMGCDKILPIHSQCRPADVPRLWVDTSKLQRYVKFTPRTSLRNGIKNTIGYFKKYWTENPGCLSQMKDRNWEK